MRPMVLPLQSLPMGTSVAATIRGARLHEASELRTRSVAGDGSFAFSALLPFTVETVEGEQALVFSTPSVSFPQSQYVTFWLKGPTRVPRTSLSPASQAADDPTHHISTFQLYFSKADCTNKVERTDGSCVECPAGGYCPGGTRVWPLPGYWSLSEAFTPLACPNAASCL